MNTKSPIASKTGYIPTLDGWRAIAVFAVISYHDRVYSIGGFSNAAIHSWGILGVDLFFAISGLLICSRLLDEEESNRRISLKDFYIRRFCRIMPPAFLFLAVLGVLGLFLAVRVKLAAWLCSLFFVGNYYFVRFHNPDLSLYTDHFWSLAIEEHFYLFLPGILYLFPRRRIQVMTSLVAAFFVYAVCIHAHPAWLSSLGEGFADMRTELRINTLLFPALLAILLRKPGFRSFCARRVNPLSALYALIAAFFLAYISGLERPFSIVIPFVFPWFLIGTILHPGNYLSRLLETAPLRYLGRISYSIYLWQQLFFIGTNDSFRAAWPLSILQAWPWNMAATILIASMSYYLLEKPFIRLGHRLAPPATPGRAEMESFHRAPHPGGRDLPRANPPGF